MHKYYEAYEERYQAVAKAEIPVWGHSEDNPTMQSTLSEWVKQHGLTGKTILDFACGEASAGLILSRLGCHYVGVDISPTAVKKAGERLKDYPQATVLCLDMTRDIPAGCFEAALDCSGFHMLVTDADRHMYLKNAYRCLAPHAPYLFFDVSYQEQEIPGPIESIDQWSKLVHTDFDTPEKRSVGNLDVYLRTLPARARSKVGYEEELKNAGFVMDSLTVSNHIGGVPSGCIIHAHKI